jgi:hypothetical protein
MGVGGQYHTPAALPPGKTRYPLCRGLGGPQSQSRRVWKISSQSGFDPRTVQPVACRYTDWSIVAHCATSTVIKAHVNKESKYIMHSTKWPNGVNTDWWSLLWVNTDWWSLLWITTLDHCLTVQMLTELLPPIQYSPKINVAFSIIDDN